MIEYAFDTGVYYFVPVIIDVSFPVFHVELLRQTRRIACRYFVLAHFPRMLFTHLQSDVKLNYTCWEHHESCNSRFVPASLSEDCSMRDNREIFVAKNMKGFGARPDVLLVHSPVLTLAQSHSNSRLLALVSHLSDARCS